MNIGKPDHRTRSRIVDRCLAAGQLQRLLVQLPGKRVRHKGFYEEVVARADIKLDSAFLLQVSWPPQASTPASNKFPAGCRH